MGKVIVNDGGQHAYVNTTGVYQRLSAVEADIENQTKTDIFVEMFPRLSGETDDLLRIQRAIDNAQSAGKTRVIFSGNYTITTMTTLQLRSGIEYIATKGTTLDFSQKATASNNFSNPLIAGTGSIGTAINLTADVLKGNNSIMVPSSTGLSIGDLILLTSNYQWTGEGDGTPHQHGELNTVTGISGNTLTLADKTYEDYTLANTARIQKVTPIENVTLRGFKILGKGTNPDGVTYGDYGILFTWGRNISLYDCILEKIDQTAVDFCNVYGFRAENNTVRFDKSISQTQTQYGIRYSNASCNGVISFNRQQNGKDAYVAGHSDLYPGIQRNILIEGNRATGCWEGGCVTHNSAEFIKIVNNIFTGCTDGVTTRISHVDILNNTIVNCTNGVYLSRKPEKTKIQGNRVINCTAGFIINNTTSALVQDWEVQYIELLDNYFEKAPITIDVRNTANLKRGWKIRGNTIRDVVTNGITINGRVMAEISGNRILNVTGKGMYLQGLRYSLVQNNLIENTTSAAIQLADVTVNSVNQVADWNTITNNAFFYHQFGTALYNTSTGTNNVLTSNTDGGTTAIS